MTALDHDRDERLGQALYRMPPHQTVAQLGTPERQVAVPEAHTTYGVDAKGLNAVFVGRNEELSTLNEAFHLTDDNECTDKFRGMHYGVILYGGPGSGKSSLMERWRRNCETDGQAMIAMDASAFTSRDTFVEHLQRTDVWRSAIRLQRAGVTVEELLEVIGDKAGGAFSAAVQGRYGIYVPPLAQQLIGSVLQLNTEAIDSFEDGLERLSQAFRKGWIIAIDEAEGLVAMVSDPSTRNMLRTVADPTIRRGVGVMRGGLLLSGLGDTVDVAEGMKLMRLVRIRMGTIGRQATEEVIIQQLVRAPMSDEARTTITTRWSKVLARDFHHWPHHTRCAALAAERMAGAVEKRWLDNQTNHPHEFDQELDWARTTAAKGVHTLYTDRWARANTATNETTVRETVALARATGNVMHRTQLIRLLQDQPADGKDATAHEHLIGLVHSGLIEPIIVEIADDQVEPTEHYRMPIHSMAQHIEQNSKIEPDGNRLQTAIDAVPAQLAEAAAAHRAREQATWNDE